MVANANGPFCPQWTVMGSVGMESFRSYIIEQGVRPCGWPASIFSTSRIILLNTSTAVYKEENGSDEQTVTSQVTFLCPHLVFFG